MFRCRCGATVQYFVKVAENIFHLELNLLFKTWFWHLKLDGRLSQLHDPVSSVVLPTSAEIELVRKFVGLLESWSVCSWYLSLSFSQNEQAFEEVFQNANFNTYEFRIRVKLETYNVSIPKNPSNVAFVVRLVSIGAGFLLFCLWGEVFKDACSHKYCESWALKEGSTVTNTALLSQVCSRSSPWNQEQ